MDENKKLRVRFNLFDALIILLVIAVLAAALLLRQRATPGAPAVPGTTRETTPMRYTVELTSAPRHMGDVMTIGSDVYRSTDSVYLGKLVALERKAHSENAYSEASGAFAVYENDEWEDLYLTIEGEGYATAKEIVVGPLTVHIGDELYVKGKGYAKGGYIIGVDTMGAALPEDANTGAGALEAVYRVRFSDVRDFVVESYHIGDRLYENITGALVGVIEDVTVEPYVSLQLGPDGTAVRVERPDRYVVYLTLRGRLTEKADGYYLDGGTELKIGAYATASSRYVTRTFQYYELLGVGVLSNG